MSQVKLSEKVQEAIFNQVQQNPINNECADCKNKSPTWVSLDFGVFVCIRCSGVHRQLGPHITRVRSTKLDGWTKENIEIMSTVGNKIGNDFYEYDMPTGFRKPNTNTSPEECRRFIDQKYIKKTWAPSGYQDPVKEFVEARKKGVKPNFGYSQGQSQHQQEEPQPEIRQPNQREGGAVRKKSMSLDKLPSDTQANHQYHDLLNADDDLLGGGNTTTNNAPINTNGAQTTSPPFKKINFANFKKANPTPTQEATNPQTQDQNQQNGLLNFDFTGGSNQNNNNNFVNNTQPKPESNVDVMKLYSQQTHPMQHQNHFMQSGSHQHSFSANPAGWSHYNNNNMFGGGYGGNMGNNNFAGGMNPQMNYGGSQGFNQNMGYNNSYNNMNAGGNFGMGGSNMGYGQQQQQQQQMNQFGGNNLYQNNTSFAQAPSGNRFF